MIERLCFGVSISSISVPGPPEALPDGLCRACRAPAQVTGGAPGATASEPAGRDINARVGDLRNLMRTP